MLESSDYLGKSGPRTLFSIESTSGKDIRAHSSFENDEEILLPPGLYFQVMDCQNPTDDLYIIQIQEIPPPFRMLAEPFDLSQMKKELPIDSAKSSVQPSAEKSEYILSRSEYREKLLR